MNEMLPAAPVPLNALSRQQGGEFTPLGDNAAVEIWLEAQSSNSTRRNYSNQASKFRLFLQIIHPEWPADQHLGLAMQRDVEDYEKALSQKKLNEATRRIEHLSPDELDLLGLKKQPFAKAMAQSSVNQSLAVLNVMYSYFQQPNERMPEPYVRFNPARGARKKARRGVHQTNRVIPFEGVQAMHAMATRLIDSSRSANDANAVIRHERMLWIFTLLFGLWGRREEVSNLSMNDFKQLNSGKWVVSLQRKGRKEPEEIPGPSWVIDGLRRYRESIGLPRAWSSADTRPAIGPLRARHNHGELDHVNAQTIYLEIKLLAKITSGAIAKCELLPEIDDEFRGRICAILLSCSPHWFRHTGPTIAINSKTLSIEHASKILGHTSLSTTSQMYYHGEVDEMRSGLDSMGDMLTSGGNTK